ncbi:VQ motif-containing protein 22-like [Cucurbita pepo subsp. pepo]
MAHQWLPDSTLVPAATTPPPSSDGVRVAKPVRKRSRASRRTPTTLLNTDAANFRAMVQQFTGGPSHTLHNFAAFDPTPAAYHLQQPPYLFPFQNHPPPHQPPFMFSAGEGLFHEGSRSNNNSNVDYMGLYDGSSLTAQNHRPA